ncbi:DoxX family protein [Nonomuraea sp. PA05]|uniref:DoxX family protein n=1 Tax=Nonomuraea sp. PA05 TaxID=2604466 RepID=UPI0011D6FF39|nr:DoxX family protein [Nonomuraea sp. PA05]TYB71352.1 DoxX family protein [Nonomuraea sp. PA05]
MSTTESITTTQKKTGRGKNIALWVGQVLLAYQIGLGGVLKLIGDPTMVGMFEAIGAGQWFRYVVGVIEIAGAIGLLIPRLTGVAALGLIGLLVCAAGTNAFVLGGPPIIEAVLLVVAGLVAWGRWSRVKAFFGAK